VEIHGRQVKVLFEDDHYNPSVAKQVCQKMAEDEKSFLLIGGAGTDQIQACAQYAATQNIPYLSAGVTEITLNHLSNYFALSQSYPDQTVLLSDYLRHNLHASDDKRIAMVAEDTSNFDDAVAVFQKEFPGATVYRPSKNENGSTMAANLCTGTLKNYDFVFPLVAPVYYIAMANAADCAPQYAGIGLTEGIDAVANLGCPNTLNAQYFNPSQAWNDRNKFDPNFEKAIAAAKKDNSSFPDDDIVYLLWGLMKTVGALLDNAGQNLTREGFIYATERATGIHTGVFPDLNFTPDNHFGASQVHVLQNVCQTRGNSKGYYVTKYAFKSSF
jgi:hypothetical protein